MKTYFIDCETCGLHGVPVLIQYAVDDRPVHIHHIWTEPVRSTLELINEFVENRVVAHNLRFDWFHLSKIFNMFVGLADNLIPNNINNTSWAEIEYSQRARYCLKPRAAVDTMLLAKKGKYQSVIMDSKPIRLRSIPTVCAHQLADELNGVTKLPWILFANRKKGQCWEVLERKNDKTGEIDPDWKDVQLSFAPSVGLKQLSQFLLDREPSASFEEIAVPKELMPDDRKLGFAPYVSLLTCKENNWEYNGKPMWPALLDKHIHHWANDEAALAYAEEDIVMLRLLYNYFDAPTDDEDAILACQVASSRLRGFAVDLEGMQIMRKMVKLYTLKEKEECYCNNGALEDGSECQRCEGQGEVGPGPMPVVSRIEHIDLVRKHKKRVELLDKLILAKRAYPDFNVLGAKSGRMSGASGLNFQGVDHSADIRGLFTFADEGEVLSAGDYSSQEVAIAATTMNDERLMQDMQTGKSLHCLFCCEVFGCSYDEAMQWKLHSDNRYNQAKSGVFLILYGGTYETLAKNLDLDIEVAEKGYNNFIKKYPQVGSTRAAIAEKFSSITQPEGPGTKIIFIEPPSNYVESIFNFRRYFDTEYQLQNILLSLAETAKEDFKSQAIDVEGKIKGDFYVERVSGRKQTVGGAVTSALYGGAFAMQNKVIRAANNHVIQSAGRTLTMGMQAAVWELQPRGIHPYELTLMSIHDELAVVSQPELVDNITSKVVDKVAEQRKTIPLTCIEWFTNNKSWAEKGSGSNGHIIGWTPEEALVS
jgi:hypothetical protein